VMTDANQNIVWQASYTPFGKATVEVNTVENNIRFPGQYFDAETGLHYNYFRDYDPEIGRYIQSDPIGLAGGINTYGYVEGNPINATDFYGLISDGDMYYGLPPAVQDQVRQNNNRLREIPQSVVDVSAGIGDNLLLGFGDDIRQMANIGSVNQCSTAYNVGEYISFGFGGARLAYATLAKAGSLAASSGMAASQFRDKLKVWFRFGIGKNWRKPNLKNKTDAQLRRSAGKTNLGMNGYGAGVAAAAASDKCGCE
jgi:RHS repeat-associated protein